MGIIHHLRLLDLHHRHRSTNEYTQESTHEKTHPANLGKGLLEDTRVYLVVQTRDMEVVPGVHANVVTRDK